MANAISTDRNKRIANLHEYLYLKSVRAETGLIGGRIFYNGRFFTKKRYDQLFPEPVIKYKAIQLDGKQLKS